MPCLGREPRPPALLGRGGLLRPLRPLALLGRGGLLGRLGLSRFLVAAGFFGRLGLWRFLVAAGCFGRLGLSRFLLAAGRFGRLGLSRFLVAAGCFGRLGLSRFLLAAGRFGRLGLSRFLVAAGGFGRFGFSRLRDLFDQRLQIPDRRTPMPVENERVPACEWAQIRWEAGGLRHHSAIHKHRNHPQAGTQSNRHFSAHKIVRIVQPTLAAFVNGGQPSRSDQHQGYVGDSEGVFYLHEEVDTNGESMSMKI